MFPLSLVSVNLPIALGAAIFGIFVSDFLI